MAANEYRADLGLLPYGLVVARRVGKVLIRSAPCPSLTCVVKRPYMTENARSTTELTN